MVTKALPVVPAERTLRVIGGRWKAYVLYYLFEGPKRLSELKKLVPHASQKVLVQALRELEEYGVVSRTVYAEVPPRVEYSLTRLGKTLEPIIHSLCDWGHKHKAALSTTGV